MRSSILTQVGFDLDQFEVSVVIDNGSLATLWPAAMSTKEETTSSSPIHLLNSCHFDQLRTASCDT